MKNLSMMKFLIGLGFFSSSLSAMASNDCCNYPTQWQLSTQISSGWLECQGEAYGLMEPIQFQTNLTQGETQIYKWGGGWYNDGLGLNSATWTCSYDTSPSPLTRGLPTRTFTSGWGQNMKIDVVLSQGSWELESNPL